MTPTDFDPKQLITAAVSMHELYESFQQAGFNKKEALYLTGQVLTAGIANHSEGLPPPE